MLVCVCVCVCVCIRVCLVQFDCGVVFDAPRLGTYLSVIYWDGSEFSLAKIIRIYESLRAVSGGPEASPHTDAHSRAN